MNQKPVTLLDFAWFVIRKFKIRVPPIEFLGKASYHVLVMQMLYYYTMAPLVHQNVQSRKAQLIIGVGCCVCSGVLFYYLEMPLTKYLQKKNYEIGK